jgi:thermostable 8-oxoguanine DNA glycosylase
VLAWVKANVATLDASVIDKHLMKAFAELCKTKDVSLTKQTIQRQAMLRAERMSLEVSRVTIEKIE